MIDSGSDLGTSLPFPEMGQLWVEVYEAGIRRGLAEEMSADHASALTSSELWTQAYVVGRKRGLNMDVAMDLANTVVSSDEIQMWLESYQLAKEAGLSNDMATQYASAAFPSVEKNPDLIEIGRRHQVEKFLTEG
jgi:hypothetical protein